MIALVCAAGAAQAEPLYFSPDRYEILPVSFAELALAPLATQADFPLEAFKLGPAIERRAQGLTGASDSGSSFALQLEQNLPAPALQILRSDGEVREATGRFQLDPALFWLVDAREQRPVDRPLSTGLTNRLEWRPEQTVLVTALWAQQSSSGPTQSELGAGITWSTPVGQLSYDWRSGSYWHDQWLLRSGEWQLGPVYLSFEGNVASTGPSGDVRTGTSGLVGNVRVLIGSSELNLRLQTGGQPGPFAGEGATSARLQVPLFASTRLQLSYDNNSGASTGLERLGADIAVEPNAQVRFGAGFDWRSGLDISRGQFVPTGRQLRFEVRWLPVELNFSRELSLPNQQDSNSLSIRFKSPL